jgi:hypothetical protein
MFDGSILPKTLGIVFETLSVLRYHLFVQVVQQLEIREKQFFVAKTMLQNLHDSGVAPGMFSGEDHEPPPAASKHKGAILQLNMGEGKTRVILPMLVLALSKSASSADRNGCVVRINFLDALLQDAVTYLHEVLTGAL